MHQLSELAHEYTAMGVLGRPDYVTWAGLMGYEDTRQKTSSRVRMGLSFAWKASLAIQVIDLLLCNRLCVTLAPSGIYINRGQASR